MIAKNKKVFQKPEFSPPKCPLTIRGVNTFAFFERNFEKKLKKFIKKGNFLFSNVRKRVER